MFSAFIIACMVDGTCFRFEDSYGPYATLDECVVRTEEMVITTTTVFPLPLKITRMVCEKIGEVV